MLNTVLNIILLILILSFLGMIGFLIYSYISGNHIITLFPASSTYCEDVNENKEYSMEEKDKAEQQKIAAKQRGSVRMALGMYYTDEEYKKYRETVYSKELP